MIKVGIIGGTGYVGAELIRLLMNHKKVEIAAISSVSFKGQNLSEIYPSFYKLTNLICSEEDEVIDKSDVIFAALPHGLSEHIAKKILSKGKICIDMGADFRLSDETIYKKWYGKSFDIPELHGKEVYGLPELNKGKIKESKLIANPGCYATSIELALLPLLSMNLIESTGIIADSKSGATGAGRNLSQSSHFTDCNENLSAYKIASHRHTPEIEEVLSSISSEKVKLIFTPHLLPINRGILSTIYVTPKEKVDLKELHKKYSSYYENKPFVKILPLGEASKINNIKLSNYCHISLHYDEENNKLILISCLDNMVKGAAGQGIQNMNIVLGFDETEGLDFVPPAF
ncbi:N-acetyl-gamma-glutamyl-phosphate reductase [Clostridium sp. 'White wine YQ']|uniref:N-acetyl-gamma-glutamyl-phosphate reductase n=1 Tax=Clostridium sp. 'White wine YQ' TaxID=3027474 RepID=UPI00236559E6|nr:N-acetyl-gamma-glutamyl-phosphate reductase [Clostridium sp. 'White wine YQ']MDD7794924.1 N-acetyl-gamma-glutamyl-phosphate reductase [Clostridium sp. 'White wine YQ']